MTQEEQRSLLYLSTVPRLGGMRIKQLIAHCGSAQAVCKAKPAQLIKIEGIGKKLLNEFKAGFTEAELDVELNYMEKHGIQMVDYLSPDYPVRLSHFDWAPALLFKKGKADLNPARTIAVVGTRENSEYGRWICENIVETLVAHEVQIVSGMAYGIDAIAHSTCIRQQGSTVAVMGSGFGNIYPAAHRGLARSIEKSNGAVLSSFVSQTIPDRERFPARNRYVAAMSDAVLVVESKNTGGSLITAQFGFELNKDVFAIPGRPTDIEAQGCNMLIKTDRARLVESAEGIIQDMMWDVDTPKSNRQAQLFAHDLTDKQKQVYDLLVKESDLHIDIIRYRTELSQSDLMSVLLELEMDGYINRQSGDRFAVFAPC